MGQATDESLLPWRLGILVCIGLPFSGFRDRSVSKMRATVRHANAIT